VALMNISIVWVMTSCRLARGLCFRGACWLSLHGNSRRNWVLYRGRLVEGDARKEAMGGVLLCCAVLWPTTIGGKCRKRKGVGKKIV